MTLKTLVVAALLLAGTSAHASLISNGDFETGSLSSWTHTGHVDIGTVPYFGAGTSSQDQSYVAVFNSGGSTATGRLTQSFATVKGGTYSVSFDYGITGPVNGFSATQSLLAEILGGGGDILASFTAQEMSKATGALDHFSFNFVADSKSTRLRFTDQGGASGNTSSFDGVLDNVSVVPEPASVALLGLGFLGFVASRRKSAK